MSIEKISLGDIPEEKFPTDENGLPLAVSPILAVNFGENAESVENTGSMETWGDKKIVVEEENNGVSDEQPIPFMKTDDRSFSFTDIKVRTYHASVIVTAKNFMPKEMSDRMIKEITKDILGVLKVAVEKHVVDFVNDISTNSKENI